MLGKIVAEGNFGASGPSSSHAQNASVICLLSRLVTFPKQKSNIYNYIQSEHESKPDSSKSPVNDMTFGY